VKGTIWINNGSEELMIKEENISKYPGFVRGRIQSESYLRFAKSGTGKQHTDEWKRSVSENQLGEKNCFYGKKHSEDSRRKMSESSKGQVVWQKRLDVFKGNEFVETLNAKEIFIKYGITYKRMRKMIDGDFLESEYYVKERS
jgi:hypothetical protein